MEIIETNQDLKQIKMKKITLWIKIAIVLLFVISIILFITIFYLKQQLFKFYVNNEKIATVNDDLFLYEGDKVYVSIRDIAPLIDYKYFQGGYKEYTEDELKCYLQSNNEICTFEEGTNTIYKTPVNKIDYQYFTTDDEVKIVNEKLYINSKDLQLACNLTFQYNKEKNTIQIHTLPYYVDLYMKNNKYSAISTNFNNQKALMYGLLVTQNIDNTDKNYYGDRYYGFSTLDNKEIVGTKYTDIEFIESTQEFIVKTTENKVGIITSDGETKVSPQYDNLKQIDKDLNLYLATVNNKQGVLEKNGKILIYPEYDSIGIDANSFQGNNIKNSYLLFNNAIPVQQNGKWGLFDKKGNKILDLKYDGIGSSDNKNTTNNIIIIPAIKTIIVSKNYQRDNFGAKVTLYGFVNYLGKELVPAGLEKVYATVNDGRIEYSMEYKGQTYNIIEKIRDIVPNLDELNTEIKK